VPKKKSEAGAIPAEKTRLLTIGDLDGRTRAAKCAMATVTAMEADLGGSDHLSAAQRALTRRAAVAIALVEHMEASWLGGAGIDVAAYTTLCNTLNRTLVTLGLKRQSRDITPRLADYIANKAAQSPPAAPLPPHPPFPAPPVATGSPTP
jgi:hypothetical protein